MRTLYSFALCLLLAGCGSGKHLAQQEAAAEAPARGLDLPQPPSPGLAAYTKQVEAADKPSFVAKVLDKVGLGYKEKNTSNSKGIPRKCKGCQFTTVLGDGNNVKTAGDTKVKDGALSWEAAATNAGKRAVQATDSAVLQNTGGGAAAAGPNASAQGGATRPDALSPLAVIADNLTSPVGYVLAAAAVGGLAYALYWLWPIVFRRKSTDPTA